MLDALAAALVHDDYSRMDVHFRPAFSCYWKRAADPFQDADDEITFATLVAGLTETWGTDRSVLLEHLPLFAAVITGKIMPRSSYSDAAKLETRRLTLPDSVKEIPLRHLQSICPSVRGSNVPA